MRNNINSIVRKAQKMQGQIEKVQEEIGEKLVEASAGGGVVVAVVNGKGELVDLKMDREVINPDEPEMLRDLIVASVNQARELADKMMNSEVEKITGGLNIPGLF